MMKKMPVHTISHRVFTPDQRWLGKGIFNKTGMGVFFVRQGRGNEQDTYTAVPDFFKKIKKRWIKFAATNVLQVEVD